MTYIFVTQHIWKIVQIIHLKSIPWSIVFRAITRTIKRTQLQHDWKRFFNCLRGTNNQNLRQQLKGQSLLPALFQLSEFFVFTVTIGNRNTMQSCRMSIMSVSKKSDNSENQTKHCMIQFANKENLLRSSRCLSFYQFIFFYWKKNFVKSGSCGHQSATWHDGEVSPVASKKRRNLRATWNEDEA